MSTNGTQEAAEVISANFIPNELTKGLIGMGVAFIAMGYVAVKFSAHNEAMLQEAQANVSNHFNAALELARGVAS